jgi:hypothetical protein
MYLHNYVIVKFINHYFSNYDFSYYACCTLWCNNSTQLVFKQVTQQQTL